jgi:putative transposase
VDASERWQILRLHVEDAIPLATLARETGIGLRTLERWHHRYKSDGTLSPPASAAGATRRVAASLVTFAEHLALTRPRPSIATLHRLVAAEASPTATAPSDATSCSSSSTATGHG